MTKKIIWRLFQMILSLIVISFVFSNLYKVVPQKDINIEIRKAKLSGIVTLIDQGRGFKMGLNNSREYRLSAFNDTSVLSDIINFGDSLYKDAGSDTIYLKNKLTGKVTKFWLYNTAKSP